MRIAKIFTLALAGLLLLSLPVDAKPVKAMDALGSMRKAVAAIGKEAKAAKLDPKSKQHEPFLSAVKKAKKSLGAAGKGLKAKDPAYFKAMHRAAAAAVEVQSAWKISGIANPKIDEAVKKLAAASDAARKNFGKASGRKKKGGALDAKEAAGLKKAKAQGDKIRQALGKLKGKSKNKALNAEMEAADKQLAAALLAAETVDALVDLLFYIESFEGSWEAWYSWVVIDEPYLVADWQTYNSSFVAYEAVYWEIEDVWVADWASMDVAVEVTVDIDVTITDVELTSFETEMDAWAIDDFDVIADSDFDGTLDIVDKDDDGDGIDDLKDTDDDNDGITDQDEEDFDSDGVVDELDADDDNDGVADDKDLDDDGDGINDDKDLDDDNDGEPDEADDDDGDLDDDGVADDKDTDDDGDGIDDAQDTDDDNDGTADAQDNDDDNDGEADDADGADDDDGADDGADDGGDEGDDGADDGGDEGGDDGE